MIYHPKIRTLEKLINERRLLQAKAFLKQINEDLLRLDELEKEKKEGGEEK